MPVMTSGKSNTSSVRVEYKADSPDEALVSNACDLGFLFLNKGREMAEIQVLGETEWWTLLRAPPHVVTQLYKYNPWESWRPRPSQTTQDAAMPPGICI
ncbi:hypothetical protein FB451DRAFT_1398593 [Mycena latifolia]|nr:hypothetical protein FB451DRAFT_1398593 [Mycena latifolia]